MLIKQRYYCPRCGSGNIQKYSVIYENGVINHEFSSQINGYVEHEDYSRSPIKGTSNTKGISMTNLASSVAPPKKSEYSPPIGCILFGALIIHSKFKIFHHLATEMIVIAIILIVIGIIGVIGTYSINNNEYPKQLYRWRRSYYCHRCGNRFIIDY